MTTYSLDALLSQFWPVDCYMSGSNCCCLSCKEASHETGKVVCYSPVFKNLPQFGVIHTVKWSRCRRFSGILCFLSDPRNVGNLISSSSAFSISSLYIWKFSVHILLKPSLKNFEHYFASMWNECSCAVVCIAVLWDCSETFSFQSQRTRRIFVGKVMSLLFNTLFRFVMAFLQGASVF